MSGELERLTAVEVRGQDTLPSIVIVLSHDGREWAKEWGAREFVHGKDATPTTRTIFNLNHISFGPYERGWRAPHFMCLLTQTAQPIVDWLEIENMRWRDFYMEGDTLNFVPLSIRFTMGFAWGRQHRPRFETYDYQPYYPPAPPQAIDPGHLELEG